MHTLSDAPRLLARGLQHLRQGDYGPARDDFQAATQADSGCADAWHLWGVCLFELGQNAPACERVLRAITLYPDRAPYHANLGLMQRAAGDGAGAVASYDRALALDGSVADVHRCRADVLKQLDRPAEALQGYDEALSCDAGCEAAHINRGILLDSLARHEEALASFDAALALQDDRADSHFNRGNALQAMARHAEAAEAYGRAVSLEPAHAWAHHNRGLSLEKLQQPALALQSYDAALRLRPHHAECLRGRAHALRQLGRLDEAERSLEQAVAADPLSAQSHLDLGCCCIDLGRPERALHWLNEAIALSPDLAQAHYNRGVALHHTHRLSEAVHSYELGIARSAEPAEMQWNKAVALLAAGDWDRGWPQYEWRWRQPGYAMQASPHEKPLWTGETDPQGLTLMLHAEQGLGDTLQFCRYARQVAALGAHVVLRVQPPLVGLLRTLDGSRSGAAPGETRPGPLAASGSILVQSTADPPPVVDAHCPLLSLPLALRRWHPRLPFGLPVERGYLHAAPAAEGASATGGRLRIGLCWRGNPTNPLDGRRSLPLSGLLSALPLDRADWALLQPTLHEPEREALRGHPTVRHEPERLEGFAATAALCASLDLVISVDTSLAHLAGALGRPTWLLLPHTPDWRWGLNGSATVWYPSMRLWRQAAPQDWRPVLAAIAAELATATAEGLSAASARGCAPPT